MVTFSEEFLNKIIHISIVNRDFFNLVKLHLKSSYFPNENYREIWDEINFLIDTSPEKKRLTFNVLKVYMRKNREAYKLLEEIRNSDITDFDIEDVISDLEEYIKRSKFVEYYDDLAKVYNSKNGKKKAYQKFVEYAEEFDKFSLKTDYGFERIFKDYKERELKRIVEAQNGSFMDNQVPFGIAMLDKIFDGGPQKGEATMVCGMTGAGKSYFAIWAGLSAARRGHNVLHFQLEGTKTQVEMRYDSAWTGTSYTDLKRLNEILPDKQFKIDKALRKVGGEIFVKAYTKFESVTVQEMRNFAYELMKEYDISLIISDYFELSDPGDRKYAPGEERQRQDKLGKLYKALAVETNTHVLTFTQASDILPLNLKNPNFHLTQSDLSEHKTKIKPFDNFLTLNQTPDERNKKMLRIWVDKLREGESKKSILIGQNLNFSRFYSAQKTRRIHEELEEKRQKMMMDE
jgi:RecA/RadA recombinase